MKFGFLASMMVLCATPGMTQQLPDTVVRPAKVMTVTQTANLVARKYPAIVLPSQQAELSFKVSGQVIELPVRGASEVVAGDVIAQLDKRSFDAAVAQLISQRDQSLAQLQALRSGARAEEVAALEASVAAAQAQVDQAQEQVERTRQLAERGVASAAKLDQDEATAQVALANLNAAREQLTIGRAGGRVEDIDAAEAALRGLESQIKTARDNLDDATLRAPFDGVVARRDIENFTNIQAGQSIVLLQALKSVDLVFDVPGPDVLIWSANEDVTSIVQLDARPGANIPAELVEFSTQADAGTLTYRARVTIQVPEGARVLPGMVGNIIVSSTAAAAPSISVPLTAIATAADARPIVWVVDSDSNAVSAQPVTLGDVSGATVRLAGGLEPGMVIVTAGVSYLREGAVIRPISRVGD